MKTKRTITAVLTALLILITLCGCDTKKDAIVERAETAQEEFKPTISADVGPMSLASGESENKKEEAIKSLKAHREQFEKLSFEEQLKDYGEGFTVEQFEEMKAFLGEYVVNEFYYFETDIEGYKLDSISMTKCGFGYRYVPVEGSKSPFPTQNAIGIGIARHDCEHGYWKQIVDRVNYDSDFVLIEDNIVFLQKHARLEAMLNGIHLTIQLPHPIDEKVLDNFHKEAEEQRDEYYGQSMAVADDWSDANAATRKFNTYEFLRDLAFRIIESAELVTVE